MSFGHYIHSLYLSSIATLNETLTANNKNVVTYT